MLMLAYFIFSSFIIARYIEAISLDIPMYLSHHADFEFDGDVSSAAYYKGHLNIKKPLVHHACTILCPHVRIHSHFPSWKEPGDCNKHIFIPENFNSSVGVNFIVDGKLHISKLVSSWA